MGDLELLLRGLLALGAIVGGWRLAYLLAIQVVRLPENKAALIALSGVGVAAGCWLMAVGLYLAVTTMERLP